MLPEVAPPGSRKRLPSCHRKALVNPACGPMKTEICCVVLLVRKSRDCTELTVRITSLLIDVSMNRCEALCRHLAWPPCHVMATADGKREGRRDRRGNWAMKSCRRPLASDRTVPSLHLSSSTSSRKRCPPRLCLRRPRRRL